MTQTVKRIALVGATGLVGQEFMRQLEALTGLEEVRLIASEDSKGELFQIAGLECQVDVLEYDSFKGMDVVLLAAPKDVCETALTMAEAANIRVIDATQPAVSRGRYHVIVPDPITALILPAIQALAEQSTESIVISTYQAVSGAGRAGVDELWNQTLGIFNQTEAEQEAFEQTIAFNCIPQIDVLNEKGFSRMEQRVSTQLLEKISPLKTQIVITGVRVPCLFGISASITARIKDFDKAAFESKIQQAGIEYHADPAEVVTPLQVVGDNLIHISRLRQQEDMVSLWVTADNIQTCLVSQAMRILQGAK